MNIFKLHTIQRPSTAVKAITLDLLNAEAFVEYMNGECYVYSEVSRKAMLNLLLNKNISLGFWVNDVLLASDAKTATYGSCEHLMQFA